MYREIKGHLIRERRGSRSLREISESSNKAFSDVTLLGWETNKWKPKKENLNNLLEALNCSYEDISEPVELGLNN